MTQTSEEKTRLLTLGKDGRIYCLDLSHHEGQEFAIMIAHENAEVAAILRARPSNMQYVLLLMPEGDHESVVMMVDPIALDEAVAKIYARSQDFGTTFAVAIVPPNSRIADLFAALQETSGNA